MSNLALIVHLTCLQLTSSLREVMLVPTSSLQEVMLVSTSSLREVILVSSSLLRVVMLNILTHHYGGFNDTFATFVFWQ